MEEARVSHMDLTSDEHYMQLALTEARNALAHDDVPVGAVVVRDGDVIARAHNQRELLQDATAHAEIIALTQASTAIGSWRLTGCTLFVTLEPCVMCAGALVLARISRVAYGAKDPKAGACASLYRILEDSRLNHRPDITAGVLSAECGDVLREFFQAKR